MNPIDALRNYAARRVGVRKIQHNFQVYLAFGDAAWPKTTLTGFPVNGNTNDSYTIEEILLCHDNRGMEYEAYATKAELQGIRPVYKAERYYIRECLNGRYLEKTCHFPPALPTSARWIASSIPEPQPKRIRMEEKRPSPRIPKASDKPKMLFGGRDLTDLKKAIASMQILLQNCAVPSVRSQRELQQRGEYSRYSQERFSESSGVDFDTEMNFTKSGVAKIEDRIRSSESSVASSSGSGNRKRRRESDEYSRYHQERYEKEHDVKTDQSFIGWDATKARKLLNAKSENQ